ncbi:MAG: hypothetical protein ABIK28_11960 [Planctomycetota bacterium]
MMKTQNWFKDWSICKEDKNISKKLVVVFDSYLDHLLEKGVSKSTFNRHKDACHALGGFIIGEIFGYHSVTCNDNETGEEVIKRFIDGEGGPLVHSDHEKWQREMDSMCKKLYIYLKSRSIS